MISPDREPQPQAAAAAAPKPPSDAVELRAEFVNGLAHSIKNVALYNAVHPVAAAGLRDLFAALQALFALTGRDVVLSGADGHCLVDGERAAETPQARETLMAFFDRHGLRSLTFRKDLRPYELAALCELERFAAGGAEGRFSELLAQKGIKRILPDREIYAKVRAPSPGEGKGGKAEAGASAAQEPPSPAARKNPPAAPKTAPPRPAPASKAAPAPRSAPRPVSIPSAPKPAPAAPSAPSMPTSARPGQGGGASAPGVGGGPEAPGSGARGGRSFGGILKDLVESSVQDPRERVRIYQDTLALVKEALDRHVAAATRGLKLASERASVEQARTEQVLAAVAEGKVIVDKEGRVLMMNAASEEMTGKKLVDVAGKPFAETINPENQMVALSKDIELPPDGKLSGEVSLKADPEVGRAMKKSLATIHDPSGRVIGTYSVLPDVTKFKEAMKMQEEFLSRVSHDLKAPLASICCALELIQERAGSSLGPEESAFLDVCLKNSRELGRMIKEILDFSKLESGRMQVAASSESAAALLRESVEALRPWAQAKGLILSLEDVAPSLEVQADAPRVVQILSNLISNAIKSTQEGGSISVGAAPGAGPDEGFALVWVKDNGCGIAAGDLQRIFEKFVQVESRPGAREGVGLGLAIVKELVGLHGGRVWVESELGSGSTFTFTLPLSPSRSEARRGEAP